MYVCKLCRFCNNEQLLYIVYNNPFGECFLCTTAKLSAYRRNQSSYADESVKICCQIKETYIVELERRQLALFFCQEYDQLSANQNFHISYFVTHYWKIFLLEAFGLYINCLLQLKEFYCYKLCASFVLCLLKYLVVCFLEFTCRVTLICSSQLLEFECHSYI